MNKKTRKNNISKTTSPLAMSAALKKGFRVYCVFVVILTLLMCLCFTAWADPTDLTSSTVDPNAPIKVVDNLSNFIFGLIRAVGLILLGFGIVQVGLSLKSHDPSQRANGFLTLAGGIVITFAKEILNLILGS